MKTRILILSWWDRRTTELRRHADSLQEKRYLWRVSRNLKEIARLRRVP